MKFRKYPARTVLNTDLKRSPRLPIPSDLYDALLTKARKNVSAAYDVDVVSRWTDNVIIIVYLDAIMGSDHE